MVTVNKNTPPLVSDIEIFLKNIDFKLPNGFIEFYNEANGAEIITEISYLVLWPITDMIRLNFGYHVHEFAPEFFIFGSDGGDMAYSIEKKSGTIFEMPFIGMSKEETVFKGKDFNEFLSVI
jgi:hypothetical protein